MFLSLYPPPSLSVSETGICRDMTAYNRDDNASVLNISQFFTLDAEFLLSMSDCWLEVSIRKILLPATSTQVFLGFLVHISKW